MNWLIFALLAVAFASTREVIQKKALQAEHTLEYLVVRGFFIIGFALLLLPFVNFNIPLEGWLLITLVALLAAGAILYRNKALKHKDISLVQPLMNLHPLFVLIIAYFALGEHVTLLHTTGIVLLVFGTYVLEFDPDHQGILGALKKITESRHSIMLMIAIVILAVTNVLDRFMLTNYTDPISYFVLVWIFMNVFLIIWHALNYRLDNIGNVFQDQWKIIIWPAFLNVLMMLSFYQAMALQYAGLVVAVFRLQSPIATAIGGRLFHEDHLVKKITACIIMTIGAVLVIL